MAETPDNQRDLKALAWALVQLQDYAQAAEYLEQLVSLDPSNDEHRLGLAQCLGRSGQTRQAIVALQPLCDREDPPFEAILIQSEFLHADGRPDDAIGLLDKIAGDHWDEPHFLLRYMQCAYAAGKDRLANDAFARLAELRRAGRVPSELMQEFTLEQLLQYGNEYRARAQSLQQAIIEGRMPWLLAENVLGNPPTWAWRLHTQDVKWLSEEVLSRAALTIYATNGFTVRAVDEGGRLAPITASARGMGVVAGLSAIVTLHELGQLERAAEHFGGLTLPSSYGELRVLDAGRFGQHQRSRETELRRIRDALDSDRIRIADTGVSDLIPIDEYANDPDAHPYRLQDLIIPLQVAQRTNPHVIAELCRVGIGPALSARIIRGLVSEPNW